MRLSLGAKFTLIVLAILAGTMAVNTTYSLRASTRFQEEQLIERGRALGHVIALVSPDAILGYDFLLLNEYAREVTSQPDVVYGVFVNPQGVPMTSHIDRSNPLIVKHLDPDAPSDILQLLARLDNPEELIKLEFPIAHNDVVLGRFLVGIGREPLRQAFRAQLAFQLLVFVIIVLFLGTAIYVVFRSNVLRPIRRLIAASRDVGRGEFNTVEVTSSDELGLLAGAFNAMTNEVKAEQAKLHRQANFDALTGLPNRMMALDRMTLEINRARRGGHRLAVLFIDLDDFKNVNDSLGHAVGDRLLVTVGARLQTNVRNVDTVARLGGDEFLVLLPNVASEVAVEMVADRLLRAVAEPQELNGRKVVVQCSIGIALYPENGNSVEALMANADNAMYQAKAVDHGSASFFTNEMNLRLRERVQMEQDLNLAIELGQLALHFQPIVDTASGQCHGAEALLRWQHPERGFVSPAEFIPLAEATGQIVGIGNWVLEQACQCWRAWRDAGLQPGFVAVNISRVQFRKRFAERLGELMSAYDIPPHALELEITESVLLDDHPQVAQELSSLHALGVRVSLDDFGTGYSSLSYLKHFRFDALKVDRSFVAGLPDRADDVSVFKAIMAMARGFNLKVIAEGVEKQEQLDFIAAQDCEFAQGYLFARPMSEAAYRRYLETARAGDAPQRLPAARQG
jgi:diguanylate cyclase (GGDEF)-like protein